MLQTLNISTNIIDKDLNYTGSNHYTKMCERQLASSVTGIVEVGNFGNVGKQNLWGQVTIVCKSGKLKNADLIKVKPKTLDWEETG